MLLQNELEISILGKNADICKKITSITGKIS